MGRMPPAWMLEVGKQTGEFFDVTVDANGRKSWRLKSLAQYSLEHNSQEQPSKKYFKGTTLEEIIHSYQWDKGSSSSSSSSKVADTPGNPSIKGFFDLSERRAARNSFIDFVSGCLRINPLARWTPRQALQHPFILDTEWTGPFVPPAEAKPYNAGASPGQRPKPQASQPPPSTPTDPPRQSKLPTTYDQQHPQRYEPQSSTYDQSSQAQKNKKNTQIY
jgi:dual specificity protein kinase YAK1